MWGGGGRRGRCLGGDGGFVEGGGNGDAGSGLVVSLEARLLELAGCLKCEEIKKGIEEGSWDLCLKMDGFTGNG